MYYVSYICVLFNNSYNFTNCMDNNKNNLLRLKFVLPNKIIYYSFDKFTANTQR